MGQLSLPHLLILAFILLIFFGPSRLPQLGQSLGKAIKGFKDGLNDQEATKPEVTQIKSNDDVVKQATAEKTEHKS